MLNCDSLAGLFNAAPDATEFASLRSPRYSKPIFHPLALGKTGDRTFIQYLDIFEIEFRIAWKPK